MFSRIAVYKTHLHPILYSEPWQVKHIIWEPHLLKRQDLKCPFLVEKNAIPDSAGQVSQLSAFIVLFLQHIWALEVITCVIISLWPECEFFEGGSSFLFIFTFYFWPRPRHVDVLVPGIKPMPQQWPELLQRQHPDP